MRKLYILILMILLQSCKPGTDLAPEEFFGLKLNKKLTGREAKEFVDRLHFSQVAPENNEIAFYASPAGKAVIYITYYADEQTASSECERMINKISPINSVFTVPELEYIEGVKTYKCFGMEQTHYIFSNEKELFWISVDDHLSSGFIKEYLDLIK